MRTRWNWLQLPILTVAFLAACSQSSTEEPYSVSIDPEDFVQRIDNPYFPLLPGTTHSYEGLTPDGHERIEDVVTYETKQVMGVTCVVVHNTVTLDGELIEETYDWYAQDRQGNVWYFGEETREFEGGTPVTTAGSWEAGVDGALPGIIMPADPQVGDVYRQEYYAGEAEDMAEVLSLSESITGPYGSFEGVLLTRDWTPLEPSIAEHKYYAPGVGLIREVLVQGGSGMVELVEISLEGGG